jgi:hypothetical protein
VRGAQVGALLAAALALAAATAEHRAAPAATAAAPASCRLVDEVPFDASSGQILVDADVGGGASRRFLFDTGAWEHYLWSEEAAALGWKPRGDVRRRDASASSYVVQHVDGVRVALGKVSVDGQSFATKPRGMRHADGLLGYPLLAPFVVEVDFVAHRLRFWSAACDRRAPGAVALPLAFEEGRMPVVEATLVMPQGEPVAARLMVDTGAGATAIFNTPFVTRHRLLQRAAALADQQAGGLGGGQSRLAMTRARELRLAGFTLARPVVELGRPAEDSSGAGSFGAAHPWDGVLGCGILSRFLVTLDYPHRRLLLAPNARFAQPFRHDALQVLLAETPEGLRVVALRPGGLADRAGLLPEDLIVAVAGAPAPLHAEPGTLTRAAFWKVVDVEGTYALEVRRGGERRTLTLVVAGLL